ncbi:MAG: DUF1571 domain-containing protein [Planctomycetota bacterium]
MRMRSSRSTTVLLAGVLGAVCLASSAAAQYPSTGQPSAVGQNTAVGHNPLIAPTADAGQQLGAGQSQAPQRSPQFVAERSEPALKPPIVPTLGSQPGEHPLVPAVRWARSGLENIEKIQDYSATLCKRERIGNTVGDYEYMFVKVRHQPLSVYLYFLSPAAVKGQEVIYVKGQNDGKMWAHTVGIRDKLVGTVSLDPAGMIAMQGQRYPLTEIGILNLTKRLVDVAEQDMKYGECEVRFLPGAKINNRTCTCIEVVHPVPRRNFLFHLARVFVDDELNVPIRYEAYDWPAAAGESPQLLEEYTYLSLKINPGFTDADFDIKNPNYRFR